MSLHRIVGWLFVFGMAYVALSALFISMIKLWGYFSSFHLLIPITVFSLGSGIRDGVISRAMHAG